MYQILIIFLLIAYVLSQGFISSAGYSLSDTTAVEVCNNDRCFTGSTRTVLNGAGDKSADVITIFVRNTKDFIFEYNITVEFSDLFFGCDGTDHGEIANVYTRAYPNCACFANQKDYCRLCPEKSEGSNFGCFAGQTCTIVLNDTCPCGMEPTLDPHKDSCCITGCDYLGGRWCGNFRNTPEEVAILAEICVNETFAPPAVTCPANSKGWLHELVCLYEIGGIDQPSFTKSISKTKTLMVEVQNNLCILSGVIIMKVTRTGITDSVFRWSDINAIQHNGGTGITVNIPPQPPAVNWNDDFFIGRALGVDYRLQKNLFCQFAPTEKNTECFCPILYPTNDPSNPITSGDLLARIGVLTPIFQDTLACVAGTPQIDEGNKVDYTRLLTGQNKISAFGFSDFKFKDECKSNCSTLSTTFQIEECEKECNINNFYSKTREINIALPITIPNGIIIGISTGNCVVTEIIFITCTSEGSKGFCQFRMKTLDTTGNALWNSPSGKLFPEALTCFPDGIVNLQFDNFAPTPNDTVDVCVNMTNGLFICGIFNVGIVAPSPEGVILPSAPQPSVPPIPPPPQTPPPAGLSIFDYILIVAAVVGGLIIVIIVGNVGSVIRSSV